MSGIERELKWQLTAAEHATLYAHLRTSLAFEQLQQSNRFFDTEDLRLRQSLCNLRLRRENQRLLLTIKRRLCEQQDGLHLHDEYERWLNHCFWDQNPAVLTQSLPLSPPCAALLKNTPLKYIGGFSNLRYQAQQNNELICLDQTSFDENDCEWELEVETEDADTSRAHWEGIFAHIGISPTTQTDTKFKRFLQRCAR